MDSLFDTTAIISTDRHYIYIINFATDCRSWPPATSRQILKTGNQVFNKATGP